MHHNPLSPIQYELFVSMIAYIASNQMCFDFYRLDTSEMKFIGKKLTNGCGNYISTGNVRKWKINPLVKEVDFNDIINYILKPIFQYNDIEDYSKKEKIPKDIHDLCKFWSDYLYLSNNDGKMSNRLMNRSKDEGLNLKYYKIKHWVQNRILEIVKQNNKQFKILSKNKTEDHIRVLEGSYLGYFDRSIDTNTKINKFALKIDIDGGVEFIGTNCNYKLGTLKINYPIIYIQLMCENNNNLELLISKFSQESNSISKVNKMIMLSTWAEIHNNRPFSAIAALYRTDNIENIRTYQIEKDIPKKVKDFFKNRNIENRNNSTNNLLILQEIN